MAQTVASHAVAAFTDPQNGQSPIDADQVTANDNALRVGYVAHDADPGIHLQSSALGSRPAAGSVGRKWMTVDGSVMRLWYDTGVAWVELTIADNVVGPASATDNAIARFDGTTGKLIQNSAVTIADTGATSIAAGSADDALIVTSTGLRQLSVRRNSVTRLDVTVNNSGTATYAATAGGNSSHHIFTGRTEINSVGDESRALQATGVLPLGTLNDSVVGAGATAYSQKTSGNSSLIGIFANAECYSVGTTVVSLKGQEIQAVIGGGVTATTVMGLNVFSSGSATTWYGIKVEDVTGSTTNYAIYTGTGLVRFGDAVNVDAGSTTNAVVVTSTGAIQQSLRYDGSNRLDLSVSSAGIVTYDAVGASAAHVFSDSVQGTEFRVAGTKVVGAQGAAVADATDAASVIARLNDLLSRLRAHGLIAT
jgi:hypothetical protein